MSNIEATPFGDKYVLVEHIATGGMAEIYRAQYQGIEGFAKELVIKVLREEFAARDDVVQMFLQEARVAATLTHNNVVHTYDLGELAGEYYIAMELLRGEELVDVLRRGHQAGQPIPLDVAVGVIMQSLEGLHYVHSHADGSGKPLGLVHRDINPTNIHVGYDGVCKILDFGIAATRASALAREGVAGKLAYMAPEQALGHEIDQRADLFALGVVLYEMVLGRRLFRGPREEVFRRVTEGDIPAPTFVQPDFPPALEAIIMRALEVEPAARYANADHMFRDLEAFLQSRGTATSPRRVSAFMASLFGEGKPAEVDYDDQYADLVDDALDFAAYDGMDGIGGEPADSTPEWARGVEGGGAGASAGPKRRMTIGNLEAFVAATAAEAPEPSPPDSGAATTPASSGVRRGGAAASRSGSGARAAAGASRAAQSASRPASARHAAIPKADQTTKARRSADRRPGVGERATGAVRAVTGVVPVVDAAPRAAFGSAVVTEQAGSGSALGWIVGLGALLGFGWIAYSVLSAK